MEGERIGVVLPMNVPDDLIPIFNQLSQGSSHPPIVPTDMELAAAKPVPRDVH